VTRRSSDAPHLGRPAVLPASWAGYFLWLGTLGFGGPIALTAAMQRDLVEERRWISPEEYKEGLALAQLAPGPLAAQLAIYFGWLWRGVLGATITGVAFVGPSFLMVLVLAWLYLRYGGLPWMQAAFYGIGAAVIAIVARGAMKHARSGRVLARLPGGRFPDGLAYAPAARKVFVSDEYGRQELVIDPASFVARRPIPMGGASCHSCCQPSSTRRPASRGTATRSASRRRASSSAST